MGKGGVVVFFGVCVDVWDGVFLNWVEKPGLPGGITMLRISTLTSMY